MAKAINKKNAFSGELIRLYEEDINRPSPETRGALAKVFERSEVYMEFGITPGEPTAPSVEFTADEQALVARYRAADPRWQLSLRLLAALAVEDQLAVATDVNIVVARILGMKPKDLRYPSDAEVAAKLGPAPHVRQRTPLREIHDGRAEYKSRTEKARKNR